MFKLGLVSVIAVFALAFSGIGQTEAVAQAKSSITVTAPAATQVVAPAQAGDDDLLPMSNCFMCSKSGSSGACSGADECSGTRKSCRKKGCKITGTRSCSSAANVKRC